MLTPEDKSKIDKKYKFSILLFIWDFFQFTNEDFKKEKQELMHCLFVEGMPNL